MSRQWQNIKHRDFKDEQHNYKEQEVYWVWDIQCPQKWCFLSWFQNYLATIWTSISATSRERSNVTHTKFWSVKWKWQVLSVDSMGNMVGGHTLWEERRRSTIAGPKEHAFICLVTHEATYVTCLQGGQRRGQSPPLWSCIWRTHFRLWDIYSLINGRTWIWGDFVSFPDSEIWFPFPVLVVSSNPVKVRS